MPIHDTEGAGSGFTISGEPAVWGDSFVDSGVVGTSDQEPGVLGMSHQGAGVQGQTAGAISLPPLQRAGVWGDSADTHGVAGTSLHGVGVSGRSQNGIAVLGLADTTGVLGLTDDGVAVDGQSTNGVGVQGSSRGASPAVLGAAENVGEGVYGYSGSGTGVRGHSDMSDGVSGDSTPGVGVVGFSEQNQAVAGLKDGTAESAGYFANLGIPVPAGPRGLFGRVEYGIAGTFLGDVNINGTLTVSGGKAFRIDHPLNPKQRWLQHSCVESPEMRTLYTGMVTLDGGGAADVSLPDWFEALNGDFTYQLTAIGRAAPGLHVSRPIRNNRFQIAGGPPRVKVSWQVTAVRHDAWAVANRIAVEPMKTRRERGRYAHPQLVHGATKRSLLPEWEFHVRRIAEHQSPARAKREKKIRSRVKQAVRRLKKLSKVLGGRGRRRRVSRGAV